MSKNDRLELAQWAITRALKLGADQAAVSISNQRDVEVEFRDNKPEKLKESTQNSLSLKIYTDQKYSYHSTNDMGKESLEKFIKEAIVSTTYLTKDEYRSLPDPKYYPENLNIELDILDKSYQQIDTKERVKLAAEIEKAALNISDKIISATASYSDTHFHLVRVHSNGFSAGIEGTSFGAGVEVTVKDPDGGRPADWSWAVTRFFNELPNAEFLAKKAVGGALAKIGQDKIESGKYTMIVENRAASRLISLLTGPMTARALQQKSSYLEGKQGQQIASEKLTLIDDPFIKRGLGSRLFDSEGLAVKRRVLIEKGVLKEYLLDDYYGKKLGLEPNSGSTSNIIFDNGSGTMEDMIKDVEKGILINNFIGGNSNSTTGDFSFGIVGQFISDGQIVKPVNEMNISGNSEEFWHKLLKLGNDPYPYSSTRVPSLLFNDIQFSGI
ncbi:TldD/PmbA family protein [candidate division KSB1 bacterium]|nr:TldD/PmbA family protein [candidate division KSB1 bacterium]